MFKIFYGNDRTYPTSGKNENPPARDVQVILQDGENGPYFQSGADYYIWKDNCWLGVDLFGLYDFLLDSGLVLFGRTITNEEYQKIYQRAKVEKSTWKPDERKP